MSENHDFNPDQVSSDAIVREMQNLNPTLLQLAASNIRAAQWREVAMAAMEEKKDVVEPEVVKPAPEA